MRVFMRLHTAVDLDELENVCMCTERHAKDAFVWCKIRRADLRASEQNTYIHAFAHKYTLIYADFIELHAYIHMHKHMHTYIHAGTQTRQSA